MNPTVSEIQNLPDGFPVVDLKVRVEKVGKPFENEGQQGKWFRQSVLVSDATGQIEVSRSWDAKDGDPYRLEAGMMVLVSAKPSSKGGQLIGVQKTTYKDKTQIRARAGFVTPIQGQAPPDGRSRPTEPPVTSAGLSPVQLRPGGIEIKRFGVMTEEEACELLSRNYERLWQLTSSGITPPPAPTADELAAWSTSILIAVGRGDVVRDHPAPEQPNRTSAELERRLTQRSAEEIVLEKARAGGYGETEPGEDPAWEHYGR